MNNRWNLADEVKQKYTPIVEEFIEKLESTPEEDELPVIEFNCTELNPYTLIKLLESLGYEEEDMDRNGWQMDFWITLGKSGRKKLIISGTGITFDLKLSGKKQ